MMKLADPPTEIDHFIGKLKSPAVLVEYGDYNCPHTYKVFEWIQNLLNEFDLQLTYIFRHFPLYEIHPNSILAALASEAANKWNNFWPMHKKLLMEYGNLDLSVITKLAEELEMDKLEFIKEMESDEILRHIDNDIKSGIESGVISTPSFFLNNQKIEGVLSYSSLRECVIKGIQGSHYIN